MAHVCTNNNQPKIHGRLKIFAKDNGQCDLEWRLSSTVCVLPVYIKFMFTVTF